MLSLKQMAVVGALALAGGCKVKTIFPPQDAGQDAIIARDTGADVSVPRDGDSDMDAAGIDARVDAADAGPSCPRPVESGECAADAAESCQSTWAAVLAAPPRCAPFVGLGGDGVDERRGTCGTYNVDSFGHVDWANVYFYDMTTGQLVAVYKVFGPDGTKADCLAGPREGLPHCTFTVVDLCPPDAGSEARD